MTSRLALALLAVAASGCVSPEMGQIRRSVARDVQATSQAEVGGGVAFVFGRGTIGSTRFLSRLVAPTASEPYRRLSRNVRQVKVARYPVRGTLDTRQLGRPSWLIRYQSRGWLPLVVARDTASVVWVLYRENAAERLTDLLTVVLADEDLVVTRVSGDLSGLVLDGVALAKGSLFGGALDGLGVFDTPESRDDDADSDASDVNR